MLDVILQSYWETEFIKVDLPVMTNHKLRNQDSHWDSGLVLHVINVGSLL